MEAGELIIKRKELENSITHLIGKYIEETGGFLTTVYVDIVSEEEYQSGRKAILRIDVNVNTII